MTLGEAIAALVDLLPVGMTQPERKELDELRARVEALEAMLPARINGGGDLK